jgi:hypothetical protein
VDVENEHIYWTNMGKITPDDSSASLNVGFASLNDGSIERADLDRRNLTTIIPVAGTFTPKQLKIEKNSGKLYWSDREGMRVMRSNLGGSKIETLVEKGHGDADRLDPRNWCVRIAIDTNLRKIYWTH